MGLLILLRKDSSARNCFLGETPGPYSLGEEEMYSGEFGASRGWVGSLRGLDRICGWAAWLKFVRENSSFVPLGLVRFLLFPRLAPWAAFLRRFAAEKPPVLFHGNVKLLVLTQTLRSYPSLS